jgi:hypothetical protein
MGFFDILKKSVNSDSNGEKFSNESHKNLFVEWHGLFQQNVMKGAMAKIGDNEKITSFAFNSACDDIRRKYGLSEDEMIKIIDEGYKKSGNNFT